MLVKNLDDGSSIHLRFRHVTTGRRHTECGIFAVTPDGGELLMSGGVSHCSDKEPFSKETGRMLSMTRALEPFTKEFRTLVWEAYWNRARYSQQQEQEAIDAANARDAEAASHLMASVSEERYG